MEKVIKRIQIDLYSPTCYEVIKAQQGDNNLRVIEFEIFADGEPYTLENAIAKLEGHRGDGSSFIKDCTIKNNIISATLDADILYDAGYVEAKVVLYDISSSSTDTELLDAISTIPFKIHVQKNPCNKDEVIEKKSVIDSIIATLMNIEGEVVYSDNNFKTIEKMLKKLIYNAYIKDDTTGVIYKIGSKNGKLYFEETVDVLTDLLNLIVTKEDTLEKIEIQTQLFDNQEDAEQYVIYSSTYNGKYPYQSFDGKTNTIWSPSAMTSTEGQYIGYKFDKLVKLNYASFYANNDNANSTWKIQGSVDGNIWNDLTDVIEPSQNGKVQIQYEFSEFLDDDYYRQFRIYYASGRQGSTFGSGISEVVFKGYYLKEE